MPPACRQRELQIVTVGQRGGWRRPGRISLAIRESVVQWTRRPPRRGRCAQRTAAGFAHRSRAGFAPRGRVGFVSRNHSRLRKQQRRREEKGPPGSEGGRGAGGMGEGSLEKGDWLRSGMLLAAQVPVPFFGAVRGSSPAPRERLSFCRMALRMAAMALFRTVRVGSVPHGERAGPRKGDRHLRGERHAPAEPVPLSLACVGRLALFCMGGGSARRGGGRNQKSRKGCPGLASFRRKRVGVRRGAALGSFPRWSGRARGRPFLLVEEVAAHGTGPRCGCHPQAACCSRLGGAAPPHRNTPKRQTAPLEGGTPGTVTRKEGRSPVHPAGGGVLQTGGGGRRMQPRTRGRGRHGGTR